MSLFVKKRVMIDPGHGGRDNGAAWGTKYDYVEEDDLNLSIAFLLRCELWRRAGNKIEIEMIREKDIYIPLIERVLMTNNWGANIFISIHADAFHKQTTSGFSVHVHPACSPGGLTLADRIHRKLKSQFADHVNRGIKRSDFFVLRKTQMPAVLVECEFISNPQTRRFLKEPENQIDIARAIARGALEYFEI